MALRAFIEGCKVKLGFPINSEYFEKYFRGDMEAAEPLNGLQPIEDYHLSINYYRKDNIWNIKVPRSNRIFLNHDVANNQMASLNTFYSRLSEMDIVVIGGTQLPNNYTHFV